jgi:hypothetical protein
MTKGWKLTALRRLSQSLFEEPVQILALEAEAAPIAKLGHRDGAFTRPAPDRFLPHSQTDDSADRPGPPLVNVTNVHERLSDPIPPSRYACRAVATKA